ncbi:MAG: 4-hydroxybenzoate polyprenyltransferase [Crocinitomix sp.]|jgi:4-hydroxybenzoate polyprenyltransferase
MDKKTAIILAVVATVLYVLMVWVLGAFGPGGSLFMSIIYLIGMLLLIQNIFPKKKKKRRK